MTEPQSWVLIGTFSSSIFGMLTLFGVMLTRTLDSRLEAMEMRLSARLDTKFDALDRDVQAIARHVFGEPGN